MVCGGRSLLLLFVSQSCLGPLWWRGNWYYDFDSRTFIWLFRYGERSASFEFFFMIYLWRVLFLSYGAFLFGRELLTWSTRTYAKASGSIHLDRERTSLYPSDLMSSALYSLMTPAIYLAPLSVSKLTVSSKQSLWVSSLRRTSWLKIYLWSSEGGASPVISEPSC